MPKKSIITTTDQSGRFLKWAGGKGQLLKNIIPLLSSKSIENNSIYYEPFLGGGAVYFELVRLGLIKKAILSDTNEELINTYLVVRDQVEDLIKELQDHRNEEAYYYTMRSLPLDRLSKVGQAARMIYLNTCGFNGLYRVNKSGQFNVPFGRYLNPTICKVDKLRLASKALHCAEIKTEDFNGLMLSAVSPGDIVYCDPPYLPISKTSNFTAYTKLSFGLKEHTELRNCLFNFKNNNVKILLSNSSASEIYQLYSEFTINEISAKRSINCQANGRGNVKELLIS